MADTKLPERVWDIANSRWVYPSDLEAALYELNRLAAMFYDGEGPHYVRSAGLPELAMCPACFAEVSAEQADSPSGEAVNPPRELMESCLAVSQEATFAGFDDSVLKEMFVGKYRRMFETVYRMGFESGWRIREQQIAHAATIIPYGPDVPTAPYWKPGDPGEGTVTVNILGNCTTCGRQLRLDGLCVECSDDASPSKPVLDHALNTTHVVDQKPANLIDNTPAAQEDAHPSTGGMPREQVR